MKKAYLILGFIVTIFVLPEFSYGQKNIGEFNRNEYEVLDTLRKEEDALGYSKVIGSQSTPPALKQYISKAKTVLTKYEERLQACRNALKNLSEIPSNQIKTNYEYKSTTEGIIFEYEFSIKAVKNRIESAEKKLKG